MRVGAARSSRCASRTTCGAGSRPSSPQLARQAVLDATKLLTRPVRPAHGLEIAVDRVREALGRLLPHDQTTATCEDFSEPSPTDHVGLPARPWATATLRAPESGRVSPHPRRGPRAIASAHTRAGT